MPLFQSGQKSLGLDLGMVRPDETNGFSRMTKPGLALNLRFLYYPLDWVALGSELGIFQFGKKTGKADAKSLALLARINFLRENSWTPYALGGVGYHSFSYSSKSAGASACDPLTGGCGASVKASSSGLMVTAGAGIEAFLLHGFSMSLETRYQEFYLSRKVFLGNVDAMSLLLGFHYWFGAP